MNKESFTKKYTFDQRIRECKRMKDKYPNRIPVIVERAIGCSEVADIDKNKFLVPGELTIAQFIVVIRKRIKLTPEQAIFLFVNTGVKNGSVIPSGSSPMAAVYDANKSDCGFLLIVYSGENTFG
jgi:GABA(A) receptor-associated protein